MAVTERNTLRLDPLRATPRTSELDLSDSGYQQAGRLRSQLLAISDAGGRLDLGDSDHQQAGRLRSQL